MSFWQTIFFSDESHIDGSSISRERELREEGTAYKPENMQQRPPLQELTVHFTLCISWDKKYDPIFYNEEHLEVKVEVKKPPKPQRRPVNGNEEEYQQRLREWEAKLPHEPEIKVTLLFILLYRY